MIDGNYIFRYPPRIKEHNKYNFIFSGDSSKK